MQLFYNPQLHPESKSIQFDKKESGHIIKSLRKINGDIVHITNGKGYLFSAIISNDNPNKCTAKITEHTYHKAQNYTLHMVVAPTKRNQRFEWFLEKATEIGVTKITPIICHNSERHHLKINRMNRVLQSAMKQSLQYHLPELAAPIDFSEFIKQEIEGQAFIAHCAKGKKALLKHTVRPGTNTTLLIGPEGDFSAEEIEMADQCNYVPISLGQNRLRTETAAVAACYALSLINQ